MLFAELDGHEKGAFTGAVAQQSSDYDCRNHENHYTGQNAIRRQKRRASQSSRNQTVGCGCSGESAAAEHGKKRPGPEPTIR
jgi:hypothetical protein